MQRKPPVKLEEDALFLWVAHSVLSEEAVAKAVAELGAIGEAYACALQVVASAAKRAAGKFSESTLISSNRDSILAGYIAGLTLVERAILGGFNAQAAALVRQELEAIAALAEIQKGQRKDGNTPNIRHVLSVPARYYGELSNAAHFSVISTLQALTEYRGEIEDSPEPATMWLLSPQHLPESTSRLFVVHTILLLNLAEHQAQHNHECHAIESTEDEIKYFERSLSLLREVGAIEDAV